MQTKHLCVLIYIWTKVEVGAPWNRFKPSSKIFLLTVPRQYLFVDHLCYLYLLFVMLWRLFIAALWLPEGESADLLDSCLVFPIKRNSRGEHPAALKLPLLPLSFPFCPYFHFDIKKIVISYFLLYKITFCYLNESYNCMLYYELF